MIFGGVTNEHVGELEPQGKQSVADAKRKESRAKQREAEDLGRKE